MIINNNTNKSKIYMLILIFAVLISGCTKSKDSKINDSSIIIQGEESKDNKEKDNTDKIQEEKKDKRGAVDLDLTELNTNILYAEVYNMMCIPGDYEGKTVKLKGSFMCYNDVSTGKEYYVCMVQDMQACCTQGIEFEPIEKLNGDTCPESGATIIVTGEFTTYEESGIRFCVLKNAEMIVE